MSISRRSFLGSLAGSSVALLGGGRGLRASLSQAQRQLAYVASNAPGAHGIHVMRDEGKNWIPVQFVASSAPSALALSPGGRTLFVANRVDRYLGLPAGSVESYSIDPRHGTLSLLSRRALSLAATDPEHLAISPDGKHLMVAATGGGSLNSFPVDETGALMPVSCVRKELGSGPHADLQASAHPAHVIFDSRHRMFIADLGADRVSVLHRQDGLLAAVSGLKTETGMGPQRLALDRTESLVVIAGGLRRSVAVHRYDLERGVLEQLPAYSEGRENAIGGWTSLAAHPEHDLLVGTWSDGALSGVMSWRVDAKRGRLHQLDELAARADLRNVVVLDPGENTFLAADALAGRMRSFRCELYSGALAWERDCVAVPKPGAIALRTL